MVKNGLVLCRSPFESKIVIISLGWVIFMRGIFAYIKLKRLTNQQHYTATNEESNCGFFG